MNRPAAPHIAIDGIRNRIITLAEVGGGRCKWLLYRIPIANTRSDAHISKHDVAVDRSPWSLACELVVGAGFQADRRDRAEIDVGLDDIPIGGGACSLGGDPMLVG